MNSRRLLWVAVGAIGLWVLTMHKKFNDIDFVARTIYGEARGEGEEGMHAVANVIMNRVNAKTWFGSSPKDVVLKEFQCSVWNVGDPNRAIIMAVTRDDPLFDTAYRIAEQAIEGTLPDITGGADHYHTTSVLPAWAADLAFQAQIGNHLFYVS